MRNKLTIYDNSKIYVPRDGREAESSSIFFTKSELFRSDPSRRAQYPKTFIMRNNSQPQQDLWGDLMSDFDIFRQFKKSYSFKERKKLLSY